MIRLSLREAWTLRVIPSTTSSHSRRLTLTMLNITLWKRVLKWARWSYPPAIESIPYTVMISMNSSKRWNHGLSIPIIFRVLFSKFNLHKGRAHNLSSLVRIRRRESVVKATEGIPSKRPWYRSWKIIGGGEMLLFIRFVSAHTLSAWWLLIAVSIKNASILQVVNDD